MKHSFPHPPHRTYGGPTISSEIALRVIEREVRAIVKRVRSVSVENARLLHPQLSVPGCSILFLIWNNSDVLARDITKATGMDKATVSRHLAHLEQIGLVTRRPHHGDRRAQSVNLTEEGQRLVADLARRRRADHAARLGDWSTEELTHLGSELSRYNRALDT